MWKYTLLNKNRSKVLKRAVRILVIFELIDVLVEISGKQDIKGSEIDNHAKQKLNPPKNKYFYIVNAIHRVLL